MLTLVNEVLHDGTSYWCELDIKDSKACLDYIPDSNYTVYSSEVREFKYANCTVGGDWVTFTYCVDDWVTDIYSADLLDGGVLMGVGVVTEFDSAVSVDKVSVDVDNYWLCRGSFGL